MLDTKAFVRKCQQLIVTMAVTVCIEFVYQGDGEFDT